MLDSVTLQFSSSTEWSSALIRRLNHSPFSHVDFVLPDGNLLGASDSKDAPVIDGNPNGVAVRPPNYQKFRFPPRRAVIETGKATAILAAVREEIGKPFDSGALYEFISDDFPGTRDWRKPDKWFCSELAAYAFEQARYWGRGLIWPKNRVSPTDLLILFVTDPNFKNIEHFWDGLEGAV